MALIPSQSSGMNHFQVLSLSSITSLIFVISCSDPGQPQRVNPGNAEEVSSIPSDVPANVVTSGEEICQKLGGAVVVGWYWDYEDMGWECRLHGLDRPAELDLNEDGSFSELEIPYTFDEIKEALPEVAEKMIAMCNSEKAPFIELSLRRVEHLDTLPSLKEAWSLSGVVIEFQCASGTDFELDARGLHILRGNDD